jgi:nucleoid-associated protein YgaU
VSVFRKLFIASALVATGLGVAHLLGEPVSIKQAFQAKGSRSQSSQVVAAPPVPVSTWAAKSVQLLPDSVATNAVNSAASAPPAPSLASPLAPLPSARTANADPQFSNSTAVVESAGPARFDSFAPAAKLRNEAPRPIGNEPRSPATIRRAPPLEAEGGETVSGGDPYKVSTAWPASPQLLPAGFTSDGSSTVATTASYAMPSNSISISQVVPPPWPAKEDTTEPRLHVIVDGDSLEKLAGRYLDDPHRSTEIFALNRELLTNPDLLPIGVELKIPERATRTSWDRQGRRVGFPNDASVREAASGNLVPVRPISSYDSIIPRAQLARPVAAE